MNATTPVCVKVGGPGALCEHVVAGQQFDNMRRTARRRAATIRGLGYRHRKFKFHSKSPASVQTFPTAVRPKRLLDTLIRGCGLPEGVR
jgi:hypothetical protein